MPFCGITETSSDAEPVEVVHYILGVLQMPKYSKECEEARQDSIKLILKFLDEWAIDLAE